MNWRERMDQEMILRRLNSIEEWLKEILRSIEELKEIVRGERR